METILLPPAQPEDPELPPPPEPEYVSDFFPKIAKVEK